MKQHIAIVVILLLSLGLRLIPLVPPSLYWEEVAIEYDAYSILKTGKDFHGNSFPIVAFESFGDYKPSLYFYAVVPFVALLGLTEWAVRLPSILAGVVTVFMVYALVLMVTNKKRLALLAALILATLPWHLQFSRAGFEVVLATALLTSSVYGLARAVRQRYFLFVAVILLVLAMYAYHGLRLLAPLLGGGLWIYWNRNFYREKSSYVALFLATILALPLLLSISKPAVSQRFAETSLFPVSSAVPTTNALRAEDGQTIFSRLAHHRYWFFSREILGNMVSHLNPQFLFIEGDGNARHQSGLFGLLYHWQILPFLIGIGLLAGKKYTALRFVVLWIILATIPPAITTVSPHTLRFLPAAPAFAILLATGLDHLRMRKVVMLLFLLFVFLDMSAYFYDYYTGYPKRSSGDWQYGYKQVATYLAEHTENETVWMTRAYGRPSAYLMLYLGINPLLIQEAEETAPKDQGELLAFDRFTFGDIPDPTADIIVSSQPQLFGSLQETIYFLNGTPAFYVYKNR